MAQALKSATPSRPLSALLLKRKRRPPISTPSPIYWVSNHRYFQPICRDDSNRKIPPPKGFEQAVGSEYHPTKNIPG